LCCQEREKIVTANRLQIVTADEGGSGFLAGIWKGSVWGLGGGADNCD